jgi:hypothetical protein
MALETRVARRRTNGSYELDTVKLGAPGDDKDTVVLGELKIDDVVGAQACEVTDAGDIIVTVNGANYAVGLASVFDIQGDRLDNTLLFIGVATSVTPGGEPSSA